MLILTESDLRSVLTMRDVIEAVEQGFRALGAGEAVVPERLQFDVRANGGILLEMPAYAGQKGAGSLGTKIVSVFDQNAQRGLGIVQAVYLLLDSETGAPLSLMEGRFITAIRTAATSAVATRHLATPEPKRLAVFGAGTQAAFHIEAMMSVAEIESILISSRSAEKATFLAEDIRSKHKINCGVALPEIAVKDSNLICTCTSSGTPLFDGALIVEGTHINAVGAFTPSTRELDTETMRRSRVVIDAESAAGREAGEILIPLAEHALDHNGAINTLADVVCGKVVGRNSSQEITVFKSCGLAIEDLVTARMAYERALEQDIGMKIELGV